jgi:hypothetical protein
MCSPVVLSFDHLGREGRLRCRVGEPLCNLKRLTERYSVKECYYDDSTNRQNPLVRLYLRSRQMLMIGPPLSWDDTMRPRRAADKRDQPSASRGNGCEPSVLVVCVLKHKNEPDTELVLVALGSVPGLMAGRSTGCHGAYASLRWFSKLVSSSSIKLNNCSSSEVPIFSASSFVLP